MLILVDTHVLIWLLHLPTRIAPPLLSHLSDPENDVCFSAVSLLEIAIKEQKQRADFQYRARLIHNAATNAGLRELPLRASGACLVADLPMHHADPFDRMMIAQAIDMQAVLATMDATVQRYRPHVRVLL